MSLHKVYRSDGSPDLRRWTANCDIPGCRSTTSLIGSADWLIPAFPEMPIYCPACLGALADFLIGTAVRCPACGSVYLTFHINDLADQPTGRPDQRWPHHICCEDCGHLIAIHDPNTGGAR